MPRRTEQFLAYLGKNWNNSLPLRNLWEVTFSVPVPRAISINLDEGPVNIPAITQGGAVDLESNIQRVIETYEGPRRFSIQKGFFKTQGTGEVSNISFLAQSISLPTDAFDISVSNNDNAGGYRGGYIAGDRTQYQPITISFLETNIDVFEYLLRPWTIACAYKGLIEDGDPSTNIKADMFVTQYSRVGFNVDTWQERKQYIIKGVIPVTIEGDKLSYDPNDIGNIVRSASFAFKDYTIKPLPGYQPA